MIRVDGRDEPLRLAQQNLFAAFDPEAHIPLRHPETGDLLGATITQGEVYAILYSLCRQMDEAGA